MWICFSQVQHIVQHRFLGDGPGVEFGFALELEPELRKTITTGEPLDIFRAQGLESDRILFSAE